MAASGDKPLRVCTVSDGVESVLRIAEYLATLDQKVERVDLQLAQARDRLQSHGSDFDLIVMAPAGGDGVTPLAAQAVLDVAVGKSARQVVLLEGSVLLNGGPATEMRRAGVVIAQAPIAKEKRGWRLFRRKPPAAPAVVSVPAVKMVGVHGMSGGAGATLLAVNLAVELARESRTCLIDLDVQFGAVGSYLDLPPEPKILNAYRDLSALDADAFASCLQWQDKLSVFSIPPEILPLDALSAANVELLLHRARQLAEIVVVNLPLATTDWTETVYVECDRIYAVSLPDVRSAANARRMLALMRAAQLSDGKVHHVLNRVPPRPARTWTEERESFEKGLGRPFALQLPDGGAEVVAACNAGKPLATAVPKSPLLAAIRDLAGALRHPVEA